MSTESADEAAPWLEQRFQGRGLGFKGLRGLGFRGEGIMVWGGLGLGFRD